MYRISLEAFTAAVTRAHGTVSFVSPACSICFASDYIVCHRDEESLVLLDDSAETFPVTHLSFPLDSIKGIEQMACTDGCTEYELAIGDGILTLDIKQERGVSNDESKIA